MFGLFAPPKTITVHDLQARLNAGEKLTVLDIRPLSRRQEWYIPDSLYLDAFPAIHAGDEGIFDTIELPTDRPVVVVCNAGFTSLTAVEMLRRRGIDAYSLEGGMKGWGMAWNVAEIQSKNGDATILQVRRAGKGCLSYVIGSQGKAMVVDAALDPEVYKGLAALRGWTITKALDTHIHADHVSRTRHLAKLSGAQLYLPAAAGVSYNFTPVHESEDISIGSARITALSTPGHTPESTSYLINSEMLLTGDTLFQNGAGRPDFASSVSETTERAHILFASLQRLMRETKEAMILSSHTAIPPGFDRALIGDHLSKIAQTNPLLGLKEDEFVKRMTAHIPEKPANYEMIIDLNLAGELPEDALPDLEAGANRCAVV